MGEVGAGVFSDLVPRIAPRPVSPPKSTPTPSPATNSAPCSSTCTSGKVSEHPIPNQILNQTKTETNKHSTTALHFTSLHFTPLTSILHPQVSAPGSCHPTTTPTAPCTSGAKSAPACAAPGPRSTRLMSLCRGKSICVSITCMTRHRFASARVRMSKTTVVLRRSNARRATSLSPLHRRSVGIRRRLVIRRKRENGPLELRSNWTCTDTGTILHIAARLAIPPAMVREMVASGYFFVTVSCTAG